MGEKGIKKSKKLSIWFMDDPLYTWKGDVKYRAIAGGVSCLQMLGWHPHAAPPPQGNLWAESTFIHAFLKDPIKLKVFEDSPFLPLLKILAVKRGRDNADLPLNFRSTE